MGNDALTAHDTYPAAPGPRRVTDWREQLEEVEALCKRIRKSYFDDANVEYHERRALMYQASERILMAISILPRPEGK